MIMRTPVEEWCRAAPGLFGEGHWRSKCGTSPCPFPSRDRLSARSPRRFSTSKQAAWAPHAQQVWAIAAGLVRYYPVVRPYRELPGTHCCGCSVPATPPVTFVGSCARSTQRCAMALSASACGRQCVEAAAHPVVPGRSSRFAVRKPQGFIKLQSNVAAKFDQVFTQRPLFRCFPVLVRLPTANWERLKSGRARHRNRFANLKKKRAAVFFEFGSGIRMHRVASLYFYLYFGVFEQGPENCWAKRSRGLALRNSACTSKGNS